MSYHAMDLPKPFDWYIAVEKAANSPKLAYKLLQLLVDSFPTVIQQVEHILQGAPQPIPTETVHKVYGSCLYSGVPRLCALCHYLEQQLHQGISSNALKPQWIELLEEINQVQLAAQYWLALAPVE